MANDIIKDFKEGDLVVLMDVLTICREIKDDRERYKPRWHNAVGVVLGRYLGSEYETVYKLSIANTGEVMTISEVYCWHPEQLGNLTYEDMCRWLRTRMNEEVT
tara:strand:+ start:508 stop:819 length:312 start_codon:yes stop_codon:yes gene_type:complete